MERHKVVISGVSGLLPGCDNIKELEEKLFSEENLVTANQAKATGYEIPNYTGQINNKLKFDTYFFGMIDKVSKVVSANTKLLLERAYEAICDSGYAPAELRGSDCAVIMASMEKDTDGQEFSPIGAVQSSDYYVMALSRSMEANRISFFFDLTGPSYHVDSSWVGGMTALEQAAKVIAQGQVRLALVGVSSLLINQEAAYHYSDKGLCFLNKDGKTKPFSVDADGYNRSEGVVMVMLQREEDARRNYGTIEKVFTSTFHLPGNSILSHAAFTDFLAEFYSDLPFSPNDIGYVEAHGVAVPRIDSLELNGLGKILCGEGRTAPLIVGSVKSRLGHTEGAASLTSLLQALVVLKTGLVPPVLHYTAPNSAVPYLLDGIMKVAREKEELVGDLVAVNCFDLSSTFGHMVLRRNPKSKQSIISRTPTVNIPRLIFLSGRDQENIRRILTKMAKSPIDDEFVAASNNIFMTGLPNHMFKGFCITSNEGEPEVNIKVVEMGVSTRPVCWVFAGMGCQWVGMGRDLLKVEVARRTLQICHDTLLPYDIDLMHIITTDDPTIFDNICNCFVGNAAIQIAMVDVLFSVGIVPDSMLGHSLGENGCGYADGCMTIEEAILCAYARGIVSLRSTNISGMMAAVGRSQADIRPLLPPDIQVSCHNSSSSCTISGPTDSVVNLVDQLKEKGIFAKLVNTGNFPYHSSLIKDLGPPLYNMLSEVLKEPKKRSSKWISTSVDESRWEEEEAQYCSAYYYTNNLLSPVLFEEALAKIPPGAVVIEVASYGLMQAILKRALPEGSLYVSLASNRQADNVKFLLSSLGSIFQAGVPVDCSGLYSKIEYPMTREVDYIHPMITWEHSLDWKIPIYHDLITREKIALNVKECTYRYTDKRMIKYRKSYIITNVSKIPYADILGTVIDMFYHKLNKKGEPTLLENLHFRDSIDLNKQSKPILEFILMEGGDFEVTTSVGNLVVKGKISVFEKAETYIPSDTNMTIKEGNETVFDLNMIYSCLERNEIYLKEDFKYISSFTVTDQGFRAMVKWDGELCRVLDSMLVVVMFYKMVAPSSRVNLNWLEYIALSSCAFTSPPGSGVEVIFNEASGLLQWGSLAAGQFHRLEYWDQSPSVPSPLATLLSFHPYLAHLQQQNLVNYLKSCFEFVSDNLYPERTPVNILLLAVGFKWKDYPEFNLGFQYSMEDLKSNTQITESNIKCLEDLKHFVKKHNSQSSKVMVLCEGDKVPDQLEKLLISGDVKFVLLVRDGECKPFLPTPASFPVLSAVHNHLNIVLIKRLDMNGKHIMITKDDEKSFEHTIKHITNSISKGQPACIASQYNSFSEVYERSSLLTSLNSNPAFHNLRVIFFDKNSPNIDKQPSFYLEQLKKGFKINVCRDGQWGYIRATNLKQVQDSEEADLNLERVSCDELEVYCIGVELKEPSRLKNRVMDEVGWWGQDQMRGKEMFGVGWVEAGGRLFTDPSLRWPMVSNWTRQQAATVPLLYAKAYHVLLNVCHVKPGETMVVAGGQTGLGRALLRTALSFQLKVYTSCPSHYHREVIRRTVPQMKENQIFVEKKTVPISVQEKISLEGGLQYIVNTANSTPPDLLHLMVKDGVYLHTANVDPSETIGMSVFNTGISFFGLNEFSFKRLSHEDKVLICEKMKEGFQTGVVEPFEYLLTRGPCLLSNPATSLWNSNSLIKKNDKHIVVWEPQDSPRRNGTNGTINSQTHLIIGGSHHLWHEYINWFSAKETRHFHIVIDEKSIPAYMLRKLELLSKKNKNFTVTFHSMSKLTAQNDWVSLLQKVQAKGHLETVILLSEEEKEGWREMAEAGLRQSAKGSRVVVVGPGAGMVYNSRAQYGLPTTALVTPGPPRPRHPLLPALTHLLNCGPQDTLFHLAHDTLQVKSSNSLVPVDMEELRALADAVSCEPCFEEVKTKSISYKEDSSLSPVFLFPGAKLLKTCSMMSKIHLPVFMARLPDKSLPLPALASSLAKVLLSKFERFLFTLVGEGWGGVLAMWVAKYLEEHGKSVEVILINAAPATCHDWLRSNSTTNTLLNLQYNPSQMGEQLRELGLGSLVVGEDDAEMVGVGLAALARGLVLISSHSLGQLSISSKLHLLRPQSASLLDLASLDKDCIGDIEVHLLESEEVIETAHALVSSLALWEHSEVAERQSAVLIGLLGPEPL